MNPEQNSRDEVMRGSIEDNTSVEDISKAQELANQENAVRTVAVNLREQAARIAGGVDKVAQSENPLVLEYIKQANDMENLGEETGEKADMDYETRQAKLLEYSAGLLKKIVENEVAISRGERKSQMQYSIELPDDVENLGVTKAQAYKELRELVFNSLGIDIKKADEISANEDRRYGIHLPIGDVRSALPHTSLHIGPNGPLDKQSIERIIQQ